MNEKEQLIAIQKCEIDRLISKQEARRKATGGDSIIGRILWFMFVYCCLLNGVALYITFSLAKIWDPLGTLAGTICYGYMFYFYFVEGFVLNVKIKKAQKELKELEEE